MNAGKIGQWIGFAIAAFILILIFHFVKWATNFEDMVIFGFVLSIIPTPKSK